MGTYSGGAGARDAAAVLITAAALLVAGRRLVALAQEWQDPAVHSRVIMIIADT